MPPSLFVNDAKKAYLGELSSTGAESVRRKRTPEQQWRYEQRVRRVTDAINEVELMQVFGGYSELQNAPHYKVERARLVIAGRMKADEKRAEDAKPRGS